MEIEFCDLKRQYNHLKGKIDLSISRVLNHGKFINGPEIEEIEKKISGFLNIKNAIGVSSGTDALLAAFASYNLQKGDFVLVPAFNFVAAAEVVSFMGATPLFMDINPRTYNLDAEKLKQFLECPISPVTRERIPGGRIKGIVAVDLFGAPADYDSIKKTVEGKNIFILEDAAQSFGAEYKGKKAGSLGDISITSFFPSKPLGCYGDGGMVFTDDDLLAEKIRKIRNHGQVKKYKHELIGLNLRLDTIQAAVLLAKFDFFISEEIQRRNRIASRYSSNLNELYEKKKLAVPFIEPFNKSVFAQYSILLESKESRDKLEQFLRNSSIPTAIHYPMPLHLQEAFKYLNYKKGDLRISEEISERIISLPMDAWKTEEEIDYICKKIKQFFSNLGI